MAFSLFLQLYGCAETCERARALLENLPQIRRIDGKNTRLLLLLSSPISEGEFLSVLRKSGISGFSLLPLMPIVYAFSRNGSPLSL